MFIVGFHFVLPNLQERDYLSNTLRDRTWFYPTYRSGDRSHYILKHASAMANCEVRLDADKLVLLNPELENK
jgi:hypothetical protein